MRDFRDAKAMARALRDALKAKAVETTHAEALELIAKAFGYDNWNILSAKIESEPATSDGVAVRGEVTAPRNNAYSPQFPTSATMHRATSSGFVSGLKARPTPSNPAARARCASPAWSSLTS